MPSQDTEGVAQPRILRGRVDSLSLYEITDYELQVLEEGSVGATYLNLAVFFLSMAVSFLATLLTTPIASDRLFGVFVVVVGVGFAAGFVLAILWYRTRRSMSKVLKRIRDRCSPVAKDEPHIIGQSDDTGDPNASAG